MLSNLFYGSLRATGISALVRHTRHGGVILCYHNVVADGAPAGDPGLHLPAAEFERQMRWLESRYRIVSLTEVASRIRRNHTLRGTAAITFDDGYAGVFEHAWPMLHKGRLPATVFVPTAQPDDDFEGFWWDHPLIVRDNTAASRRTQLADLAGDSARIANSVLHWAPSGLPASHRRAGWETIARAAAQGLDIGVHSVTHRNLTQLRDDDLQREVVACRQALFERTGVHAASFSYPYGLVDTRVREAVHAAGYRAAVTLHYGLNTSATDPLMLRRVNVPASIPTRAYEAWTTGLRPRWRP
jgi:peptidoglycan/xylan/chitin deacetylase (PgdA/CDA1 family)